MKRILIVSTEKHAGKSLLALARSLQERGLTVAYMKPISFEVSYATGEPIDRDADAVRSLLSLDDDLHDVAPVPLEGASLREAIEGRTYLGLGVSAGLSDLDLADLLATDVILLARYDEEESIDRILCTLRRPRSDAMGCPFLRSSAKRPSPPRVRNHQRIPQLWRTSKHLNT